MSMDLCIVCNLDAKAWPNYILGQIHKLDKLHHVIFYDSKFIMSALPAANATVVIASPGHLDFLKKRKDVCYKNCSAESGLIILCGVDDSELSEPCSTGNGSQISDHFPNFSQWTRIAHNAEPKTLRTALENLLKAKKSIQSPDEKTGEKKSKVDVHLLQSDARCEESSTIVLAFSDALSADDEVTVMLLDSDLSEKCSARRVNPQTYTFIAPEHQEGEVKVKILVNNEVVASSLTLTYRSVGGVVHDVSQIYMHLMNTMCSLLLSRSAPAASKQHFLTASELDEKLSSLFDLETGCADVPARAFEHLFGIYRYDDNVQKDFELPTLIHFAAKFGLKELCAKLTDLPDANFAFKVSNNNTDQAHQIAHKWRHDELAKFLESWQDMGKEFESIYASYTSYYNDTGGRTGGRYYNATKAEKFGQESEYVDMTGKNWRPEQENTYMYYGFVGDQSGKPPPVPEKRPERLSSADRSSTQSSSKDVADVNMPSKQQKLVEIMEMYKQRKISMREVEAMFRDWQVNYEDGQAKSFKEKQERLMKLKEVVKEAKTTADGTRDAMVLGAGVAGVVGSDKRDLRGQRDSGASLSSRDSRASRGSRRGVDSGIDTDYAEDTAVPSGRSPPDLPRRPQVPGRKPSEGK